MEFHWEFHVLGRFIQGQHALLGLINMTQCAPKRLLFSSSHFVLQLTVSCQDIWGWCQNAAVRVDTMCVPCGGLHSKTRLWYDQMDIHLSSGIYKSPYESPPHCMRGRNFCIFTLGKNLMVFKISFKFSNDYYFTQCHTSYGKNLL